MRIVAIIVGILGSMGLFAGGVFGLLLGGLGEGIGTLAGDASIVEEGKEVVGLGVAAIILSIVALVGACLSIAKPKVAAILMVGSGIGGFICIYMAGLLGAILLLVGSLFAFLGRNESKN